MQISHTRVLVDEGSFSSTSDWQESRQQVLESIEVLVWPPGNDRFILKPEINGNGVNPITDAFESVLGTKDGWDATGRTHFKTVLQQRGMYDEVLQKIRPYFDNPEEFISSPWFDAVRTVRDANGEEGLCVVEWETGNISSSHRSLNRITLGLVTDIITGGFVILPTRDMYSFLTDRVGNYPELEPYFVIWESLAPNIEDGVIEVIAVEHDGIDEDVPVTGKLKDGMADRAVDDERLDQSDFGEY